MSKRFSIKFYLRTSVKKKNGHVSILVKFACNGMSEILTHVDILPEMWNSNSQRAKGYSNEAREINEELDKIADKLKSIKKMIEDKGEIPTSSGIKEIYQGKKTLFPPKPLTLLAVFDEVIQRQEEKVKADLLTSSTLSRYKLTMIRLKDFIKEKYKVEDIEFANIDVTMMENFELYLLTKCKLQLNTACKPLRYLRALGKEAVKRNIINYNPFDDFPVKKSLTHREPLTEEELTLLLNKPASCVRLEKVRDAFIFSCFTGLAFTDINTLTKDQIYVSENNEYWIITKRNKTNVKAQVLLTDIPVKLLHKYNYAQATGKIFPIVTNQKVNAYLKEIADICGINKTLTFHVARHTFATTVTLERGVPIETVQMMLGHSDIKTTQIYARITKNKIKTDMEKIAVEKYYKAII